MTTIIEGGRNACGSGHAEASGTIVDAQQIALEVVDPRSLPFDPEVPEGDDFGRDEPIDERYGWPVLVSALGPLVERLRPARFSPR